MLASNNHTSKHRKLRPITRLQVVATKHSQSTPTQHYYEPTSAEEDSLYSPAASTTSFISSVSWVAEKSASELGSLLKSAYKSLREKEKNLLLAAEIGKSLLEHNQNLKSDYDKLLQNVKRTTLENNNYYVKSTNHTYFDEENEMRLISNKKAYDTIIASLQTKNAELQQLAENAQQSSSKERQQQQQKQRKLESEINSLKQNLEIAAQKVQELEETSVLKEKQVRILQQAQKTNTKQDLALMEELTVKMEELFIENKHLQSSKKSVEEKLIVSLQDLDQLRKDFENFELTQQGYNNLQVAFERQSQHIRELNDSLEEHRALLFKLREKGLLKSIRTANLKASTNGTTADRTTTTAVETETECNHLLGELENAWSRRTSTSEIKKKQRSYSETDSNSSGSTFSKLYGFASMTERNLTSFYNAPGNYARDALLSSVGLNDCSLFEEAEQLLNIHQEISTSVNTEDMNNGYYSDDDVLSSSCYLFGPEKNYSNDTDYAEMDLYPSILHHSLLESLHSQEQKTQNNAPKGLANRILFHIRYLYRSIFRWCRFAIVLATAIMINLWKGPDLALMDHHHAAYA